MVVTIHNAGLGYHQDVDDLEFAKAITGLPGSVLRSGLFNNAFNPFVAAAGYAQVNTVSENYARELQETDEDIRTGWLGHELLKKWNLPEKYCDITQQHHSEVLDKDDLFIMAVQLGNKACNNLDIGLRGKPLISPAGSEQFHVLGLSETDMDELDKKLEDSKILAA